MSDKKEVVVIANSVNTEWYQSMIDELGALKTEKLFTSRWSIIEFYHELGTTILENRANFDTSGVSAELATKHVSLSLDISLRSVQLAVQFAKMFPDLDALPDGKNVSWHKIVKTYLPAKKEEKVLPELLPTNELQNLIVKYSLFLAQNSKMTINGVVMVLPNDMK